MRQLRALGCSVATTHTLGKGFPDIVVGYRNRTYLFEIKDPAKPPNKRRLTKDEKDWHDAWKGHAAVVETLSEILRAIGANRDAAP